MKVSKITKCGNDNAVDNGQGQIPTKPCIERVVNSNSEQAADGQNAIESLTETRYSHKVGNCTKYRSMCTL